MEKVVLPWKNVNHIVLRLDCCAAVFRVIHATLGEGGGDDGICDALHGACDLLETITENLRAVIDSAEDYKGAEK